MVKQRLKYIGERLKRYRLSNNITPDDMAKKLDISRAALYRAEKGEIVKIDTLFRLTALFNTSATTALGLGSEYYPDALGYFKGMHKAEETAEQIVAYFPPFSYLLTSSVYPKNLKMMIMEGLPSSANIEKEEKEIDAIIDVLNKRKHTQKSTSFSIINFISASEIERWLKLGMVGTFNLPQETVRERRIAAKEELEHLISIIQKQPMGLQIALLEETVSTISFQLFKSTKGTLLGLSPYRLGGEFPNVHTGIATITSDEYPVQLYEDFASKLWQNAYKGSDAVDLLKLVLKRSGI